MLITVPSRRWSFSSPVTLLAFAGGLLALAVRTLRDGPPNVGKVLGTMAATLLFAAFAGRFRLARVRRDGRLFVRTLFEGAGVNPTTCALGISVVFGSRGHTSYTVYATDGTSRIDLAECGTKAAAERALQRLENCFVLGAGLEARRPAQARVDAERQRWEADFANAKAQVDAYYASGAFRKIGYLIISLVAVYLVGIAIYAWLTKQRL